MRKIRWMLVLIAAVAVLGLSAAFAEDSGPQVGSTVVFGWYEQDNNTDNGPEPIEWIVLDIQEGKALLLSRYGLDVKVFRPSNITTTWAVSTLRKWLNSDFIDAAFTEEERSLILLTDVDNSALQQGKYSDRNQDNTQDQVFLLSYHEVFDLYLPDNESRMCAPTEYAKANGAYTGKQTQADGRATGRWWLRSRGSYNMRAAAVNSGGKADDDPVAADREMVRPALWIDTKADAFNAWACPSCGRENAYDSAFCPWCGEKRPAPEAPVASIICPGCGAEYEPDTEYLFCRKCGTKLPRNEINEPEATTTPAPVDPKLAIQATWVLQTVTGTDTASVQELNNSLSAGCVMKYTFKKGRMTAYVRLGDQENVAEGDYSISGSTITIKQDYWEFGQDAGFALDGDTLRLTFSGSTRDVFYIMTFVREE